MVTIKVINNTHKNLPGKPIGQEVVNGPKGFPIAYELEYDEEVVLKMSNGKFLVTVTVETSERSDYTNKSNVSLIDTTKAAVVVMHRLFWTQSTLS